MDRNGSERWPYWETRGWRGPLIFPLPWLMIDGYNSYWLTWVKALSQLSSELQCPFPWQTFRDAQKGGWLRTSTKSNLAQSPTLHHLTKKILEDLPPHPKKRRNKILLTTKNNTCPCFFPCFSLLIRAAADFCVAELLPLLFCFLGALDPPVTPAVSDGSAFSLSNQCGSLPPSTEKPQRTNGQAIGLHGSPPKKNIERDRNYRHLWKEVCLPKHHL